MAFGETIRRIDWWLVLFAVAIAMIGVLFVKSATHEQDFHDLASRQVLYLFAGALAAAVVVAIPYPRILRRAPWLYAAVLLLLAGLPFFGSVLNGARRWYRIFGFGLQPSEFAKIAVIVMLASWFRLRDASRPRDGVLVPMLWTALPVGFVFLQPDLGSSLVFWPIAFAMCYAAGAPPRWLAGVAVAGVALLVLGWFTFLHDYQRVRVETWAGHFGWTEQVIQSDPRVQEMLQHHAYQPWQSLIAIGSGGVDGFGYMAGPQNRFDFLPYRSGDYIFAVVVEETGLVGAAVLLALFVGVVVTSLRVAMLTRERFGRLLAVGVATWIGTQAVLHVAVCAWMVPATGLPMPLVSHGGSGTLAAAIGLALVVNVSGRRELVISADGFR